MRFTIVAPSGLRGRYRPPIHSWQLQELWRSCESWTAFFATFSLVPATVDYELRYSQYRDNSNCATRSDISHVFRWLTLFLTIPAAFFLILRYLSKRQWLLLKTSHLPKAQRSIRNYSRWSLLLLTLCLELLVLVLFPYPSFSDFHITLPEQNMSAPEGTSFPSAPDCFLLAEVLYCLMFLRAFFLVRALLNYSGFNDSMARRICSLSDTSPNLGFNIRTMARGHPWVFLAAVIGLCWVTFSQLMRVVERPYANISTCDFASVFNAQWFTVATLDNAPYGDYWPQTHVGRGISYIMAVISMCIVSVAYTLMSDFLEMSSREKDAFEQVASSRLAVRAIEAAYIYHRAKARGHTSKLKVQAREELDVAVQRFWYQLPRLGWKVGLSERQISEKYGKLLELDYSLWRIESKLIAGCAKLESDLDHTDRLLSRLKVVVSR